MQEYHIGVVVGSLRRDSFNLQLAKALVNLAPPNFKFTFLATGDLPLYNQDHDGSPAPAVVAFKNTIKTVQGLLFVTPEYNRSIPGVLKNALDHGSRPYGQSVWAQKPAGVLGVSVGAAGTAMAQQHLRNILAYLDMPTLGQPEAFIQMKDGFFDKAGHIANTDTQAFLQNWMNRYVDWIKKHQS